MYTITLANGMKLKDLELNGNNYISKEAIDDSAFVNNLAAVTITDGKVTESYTDMVLIGNRVEDGCSWFVLGEKTAQEKAQEKTEQLITSTADGVTDVQVALAEVYELILMGGI